MANYVRVKQEVGLNRFRWFSHPFPSIPQWGTSPASSFGVLTGANAEYMPTLHPLVRVCKEQNIPITVVDHGLTKAQTEILKAEAATLVKDGSTIADAAREISSRATSTPEAWLKPLSCLKYSTYKQNIWIDSDAVPVGNLQEMFRDKAWLTRDWWVEESTWEKRYGALLKAFGLKPSPEQKKILHVNSGVFGFAHGDRWVQNWAAMCEFIQGRLELLKLCGPRDQSALVVSLLLNGNAPPISDDSTLNFPANGLASYEMNKRKRYPLGPEEFLNEVRADHPEAKIVHWLGKLKPWRFPRLPEGKYTRDWTERLQHWLPLISPLKNTSCQVLEIGSYEGRTTRWLLDELGPGAKITCVDIWQNKWVEERFDENLKGAVTKLKGPSQRLLRGLKGKFQLIYIDGSHFASDVLADAILAWSLLEKGGLLIFDDYELNFKRPVKGEVEPKVAIDSFLMCFAGVLEVVHHDFQVIVRKR